MEININQKNVIILCIIYIMYYIMYFNVYYFERLSRARRYSENAFGVLDARFQIFRTAMRYDPDEANRITMTCCCLHNMLRS